MWGPMSRRAWVALLVLAAVAPIVIGSQHDVVVAQTPPATVWGSITDANEEIPEGVIVRAYIGTVLCGEARTKRWGEGESRVTVYAVNVLADGDAPGTKPGCGRPGLPIRLQVGDRFVEDTIPWNSGPIRYDVAFSGATPVPIPTFTPTPEQVRDALPTRTAGSPSQTTGGESMETVSPVASPTARPTREVRPDETETAEPTRPGGLATATASSAARLSNSDGEGAGLWVYFLAAFGGIVALGGGAGLVWARRSGTRSMEGEAQRSDALQEELEVADTEGAPADRE